MNNEVRNVERQGVQVDETAEPGPGADTNFDFHKGITDIASTETLTEGQADDPRASDGSTDVPRNEEATAGERRAPAEEEKPFEAGSTAKKAVIMTALGMAVFLAALDVTIITTALPTISEHFHSSAGYTWIGSAYLLANSASTPTWGKISDIFGRKPVLLLANVIFLIGSLVAALSNSIGMLIAARAVQGLGGGGLVVLVNICIGDLFSLRSRGAYYGIIGGVWALASAIGPIIGGLFTEKVTWRWCFYINLPLDGAAFFIILFFLDLKTPRTPVVEGLKAIDWLGSLTVVGGTLMLLFGLQYGGVTYPWSSAIVICLIVFGFVTLGLFFINEWKLAKYPVMPLAIFSSISNAATLLCCFVHGMVFIAGSYYLPLYFQVVRGATPILSGVYLLPTALSLSFASLATGIYIRKSGKYLPPIYFGFFMLTLGYGLFTNLYANSSWAKLILYQIVAGVGIGPLFQAPLIALQGHVKPRDIATATATFGFVRQLATSISVVIGSVVYQNQEAKKQSQLAAAVGPQIAQELSGNGAGANVQVIDALPPAERTVARVIFADSLHTMWIMYVCIAAVGLLASFLITKKTLTKQHEVTQTGLEKEKANQLEREQEKRDKAALRAEKKKGLQTPASSRPVSSRYEHDLEKGDVDPMPTRKEAEVTNNEEHA